MALPPSDLLNHLNERLRKEILILDGAMGSMIQQYKLKEEDYRGTLFNNHPIDLKGNNDLLCLTKPEVVAEVHRQYLEAGAEIIETCTFNGTSIAQKDYGLESQVRAINLAAAKIAKDECLAYEKKSGKRCYVAGALGPTNRTASISPDVNDPSIRNVTYNELVTAYYEQAKALIDGGVDILLPETVFDTLNLKACLFAIEILQEELDKKLPLMISVTITDLSGRTLSGQTVEAFWNSVRHAKPLSVGINCALGAKEMRTYIQELSRITDCYVSCYPNAGLPNPLSPTGYDETPEELGNTLLEFATSEFLNVVGGCCGTTPAHIKAIAEKIKKVSPRTPKKQPKRTRLSGLEPLNLQSSGERAFVMVGERTNVTGSSKFASLIRDNKLSEALEIAKQQVENGANIIDINFDDAMLDGVQSMRKFLNLIASEPDIAKVPIMIDSSKFSVLEAGLQCIQGKPLVNSISLKEGESVFKQQALLIKKYGGAVVVMAFDEKGQATTKAEKVAICQRTYAILTKEIGFDPTDIVFDPNILTVATGLSEHDNFAVEYIESLKEIKTLCPGALTSGGISNLSFSFRGNQRVREAMHTVFLYHAIKAGLDMGIVNAGMLQIYDEINPILREACEDVILNRSPLATEKLLQLSVGFKGGDKKKEEDRLQWRQLSLQERVTHSLVNGVDQFVAEDIAEALKEFGHPLAIIEGPLMKAMNVVGDLFGAGKMFLPQVVKSARVMKKAVAILEPLMQDPAYVQIGSADQGSQQQKTFLIATVKGDVHDIGKNIVSVVLACNGYRVVDLGIMTSMDAIRNAAIKENADFVGMSGLITPSLDEMIFNCQEFEKGGLQIPLLIGGATTSKVHTAVKIDPHFSGAVIHVADASRVSEVCKKLIGENRAQYIKEIKSEYKEIRDSYLLRISQGSDFISLEQARAQKPKIEWRAEDLATPTRQGVFELLVKIEEVIELIDWSPFFWVWELKGAYPTIFENSKYGSEAKKLFDDAQLILQDWLKRDLLRPKSLVGIWPACAENESIFLQNSSSNEIEGGQNNYEIRFQRQRRQKEAIENCYYCLADFIAPKNTSFVDFLGGFAVTAGFEVEKIARKYREQNDDYSAILSQALGDRIAEGLAEWTHQQVRNIFQYGLIENLSKQDLIKEKYRGIRPAPGYPACPDHKLKLHLWKLMDVEKRIGVSLTETLAMNPPSSVSGFIFNHPKASYFHITPAE